MHAKPIAIQDNRQVALTLAANGFKVFPVRAKDKHPLCKWKTEATTDPIIIHHWWKVHPKAMPAIRTGEDFDVLDLDRKDGKNGFKVLEGLGLDPAALSWIIVETPSGGWHLYYRRTPGLRCSVGQGDLAGVDVRAERGFVVAPGASNAKGSYQFIKGNLSELRDGLDLTGMPVWPSDLPMQARAASGATSGAEPSGLPLAALRDALMAMPIETREAEFGTDLAWFKVARIIVDETGGSEEGNELWHEWSADWGGYDYHKAEDKWNREDTYDGERATVWTILNVALKVGWTHPDFEAWKTQQATADLPDGIPEDEEAEIAALVGMVPAKRAAWGTPMMQGDKPINNQHNAIVFLGRNVDSVLPDLRRNLMTHRDEWRDGDVTDSAVVLARTALERLGMKTIGKELVADAITVVAHYRQYHPIRDELARLRHDGKARLDSWLVRHTKAEDSPYVRAVGRKFLIQMVARVMQPGCKADHTLVLVGPQGVGKSSLCRLLAGAAYFTDTLPSITGGKDGYEHLQGIWLSELSELAPSRKADAEDLKAFLTGTVDRFRTPYGKRTEPSPRQCVFVGTTNDDEFLRDATGGRRFWPVHVGKIDLDAFAAERDQLLAEAVAAFHAGEPWWMEAEFEAEHARPVQEAARVRDSWEGTIAEWLAKVETDVDGSAKAKTEVTLSEVMIEALGLTSGQQTMAIQKRAGEVMRALGWEKVKTMGLMVWRLGAGGWGLGAGK